MSTTTNPSHILIARNSRGTNNPSASLSSPTETHAAASGIFRATSSPPWLLEEFDGDSHMSDVNLEDEPEEAIDVDESFTRNTPFPGSVKIVVENTTFWAHKEILYFSSPFFQAILTGDWSETGRTPSISPVMSIGQSSKLSHVSYSLSDPTITIVGTLLGTGKLGAENSKIAADHVDMLLPQQDSEILFNKSFGSDLYADDELGRTLDVNINPSKDHIPCSTKVLPVQAAVHRNMKDGPDAVIIFKEEKASIFHDFLKFVYPHLECTITWNNVEGLMNLANKLCVPPLQRECLGFLLTHAAGKPIKALHIAEIFEEEDLYREASRFVLDNPGGWSEHELNTLSKETLLKLEKRRNWFLERVLKLGLTMIAKEYQCVTHCVTCPDPPTCARLLDEKWRQAYHSVFRFGPPQPSMVFRYLRMLEGVSPPLSLTQTACQASAKAFTATLFDRMFSLGVRGSGIEPGSRSIGTSVSGTGGGPRRHFLYCTLKTENIATHKPKKSKEIP
ncbi:hypothetical protein AMATHDRAFT_51077 [Amanita thiersii Skay4041]|uniref:BTB domain-containing protein n=1 Tax=Amanita thiersii Skay4041 TaxID=703135 RepID=A0A2A9N7I0_9AGAR|nr:hypothetical protein AMATHDRAFT_51077 [Amanita thiersii Skay4041]